MALQDSLIERDAHGVPAKPLAWTGAAGPIPGFGNPKLIYLLLIVSDLAKALLLGYGIYWYTGWQSVYDAQIDRLASMDLGWVHLSVYALKFSAFLVNGEQFLSRAEANIPAPDQYVYHVVGQPDTPIVLMSQDGALGRWNRAQRALQNFHENLAPVVAYAMLAGFVCPRVTFACVMAYCLGRCVYTRGYVTSGVNASFSQGRFGGFFIMQTALAALEGVVLVGGCKAVVRASG